ncbi:type 1 glutamine amidotransferase domain-containing protein [Kangiella marina]|uniref:Type 1 glutamine amidotransferase domain-containing protein n=1 Tax=Kangiella marina TaxID=1079178 RepID=A0ABP8IJU0_9GAMM
MKVLMILTSHDQLGDTGNKTGFWLEEFTSPYYVFKDAGANITLASPKGGQPPLDPNSDAEDAQTDTTQRFKDDKAAQEHLATTKILSDINPDDFDAVFYPGGHGPLWDLAESSDSKAIIEKMYQDNKPVGAVCHAPAVFKNTKDQQGNALVSGKKVTGFSNSEEAAVELTDVVPFLVEDMLQQNGGQYSKGNDWESFVQIDGNLITGQNPASSAESAKAVLAQLG